MGKLDLNMSFNLGGLAGCVDGKFIGNAPSWVDLTKPPGTTSQDAAYCPSPAWWAQLFSGYQVIFGPNLVWLLIALAVYFVFPYDLTSAARAYEPGWIIRRALVNVGVTFAYTGFWHVSLYWLALGKRPFKADRIWRWGKLLHNMTYTFLGALQWTGWEVLAMRCWATGRLPYLDDAAAFGTCRGALHFLAACFWVPLWRTWHFYFAHRLLHYRPLYKWVHSLHHRNTDIEPFSGLTMHPVEHLYYFACAAPSLYVFTSPFAFTWNGVHLLLSPAASHSGFEDHFQSDQFHYLHHKHFECNYGPSNCPLDRWFGTFKAKLEVKTPSKAPSKAGGGAAAKPDVFAADAKSDILGWPEAGSVTYGALAVLLPLAMLVSAITRPDALPRFAVGTALSGAHFIALACSVGPVAAGCALLALTEARKAAKAPRKTFLAPFHRESLLHGMGLHLLAGAALTVMPVFHLVHMTLAEPGQAACCYLLAC